ncbi:MAG: sulfatase-like hydrolase/transferase [bacterium]
MDSAHRRERARVAPARARSRHALVAIAAGLALLALIPAAALLVGGEEISDGPNIVLIISDDQRDDTLGVMDQTRRRVAHRGVDFENGIVTTPLCCPSRVSIMTGQYVHNHRVLKNRDAPGAPQQHMIAAELNRVGYFNGLYGKYLNNWPQGRPPANYDEYELGYGPAGGYEGKGEGRERADDWLAKKGEKFIERREDDDDDRPFLLVLSARSPHNPLNVPNRYQDARVPKLEMPPSFKESDLSDKPAEAVTKALKTRQRFAERGGFEKVVKSIVERQQRLLLSLDDMVGTTMDALDAAGEADDTLVFYISDNGVFWGEHGFVQKTRAYPEGVEVPLLMRWPAELEPEVNDQTIAANIDIAPTIYEAAGIEPDYEVDGRSLLGDRERRWSYIEKWTGAGSTRGIFIPGEEQYLENRSRGGHLKSREYYDLEADPYELENLIDTPAEPTERVAELERMTVAAADCVGRSCP